MKEVNNKDDEGSGFVDEESEIQFHVGELEILVDLGSDDVVRAIGICGSMTKALAFAFYERDCHKFDACCFFEINLDNFMPYGIASLQHTLLQQILKKNQNIWNVDQGTILMSTSLRSLKTLLVLDKVDHPLILSKLAQIPWFGAGSRIIITTTNEYQLEMGVHDMYRAEKMNHEEACQDSRNYEIQDHKDNFSVEHMNHIEALQDSRNYEVLDQQEDFSDDLMNDIEPCKDSRNDGLLDLNDDSFVEVPNDIEACQDYRNDYSMNKQEMDVFLDIACFFVGHEINYVKEVLGDCYDHSKLLISTLIEKSLISISDQKIAMLQILQVLGQRLVQQEFFTDIENRSRLWYNKETLHILQVLGQRPVRQEFLIDIENRSRLWYNKKTLSAMARAGDRFQTKEIVSSFRKILRYNLRYAYNCEVV